MTSRMDHAVATAHPIATAIGQGVLDRGGNSYDAALAVSAALPVVLPYANGLGSDLFAVIYDRSVTTLNASGPAAELATPERFEVAGLSTIPEHGPLSAFTVPGLVAGWSLLAERATERWKKLLAPAVRLAGNGVPVTPFLAEAIQRMPWADSDWRSIYQAPHPEGRLRQREMARTLEAVAADGGHGFYHGDIARTIERDMIQKGGLLRFEDLDRYRVDCPDPIKVRYRGYDVFTTPPNSQGATALYWLHRLARQNLGGMETPAYVATLLETMYPAYEFRARYIGDPRLQPLPENWLELESPGASLPGRGGVSSKGRDTTAFSVFDGEVGISAIQSNYQGFGAGHTVVGTGINLNDRGSYFTLDRAHHNVVAPLKKTFHTLMATAAKGPDLILLGSMGGDVQPQVHVQVLTGVIDRERTIQAAIDSPRFAYPATIYSTAPVFAEGGTAMPSAIPPPTHSSEMGHCQGIVAGSEVLVGIDPRGEGRIPIPGWASW